MISLFEPLDFGGAPAAVMSDLVERMGRGVAPLEFGAVDQGADEPAVAASAVPEDEAAFSVSERARQVIAMVNAAREETSRAVRGECEREIHSNLQKKSANHRSGWVSSTAFHPCHNLVPIHRRSSR